MTTTPKTPNPDSNESQGGVLLALAARCEAATGADRKLDAEIWAATDDGRAGRYSPAYLHSVGNSFADIGKYTDCPRFTASLDAAMMTVPDGWSISMHLSENGLYPCVKMGRSYPTNANVAQEGATLPLAICAGSLRARSLSGEGGRA